MLLQSLVSAVCTLFCLLPNLNLLPYTFNLTALRKPKTVYNFGLSECSRIKNSNDDQVSLYISHLTHNVYSTLNDTESMLSHVNHVASTL